MPQFNNADRTLLNAEQSLWIVSTILREESVIGDHGFTPQIKELLRNAEALARELRDYNDQWEEE